MAKRLSELGIMIVFGYTLWLIVSLGPTLERFFCSMGGDAAGIGGLNVANVLAFVIVARWLHPFGLCGEHGLRFGVRLSDDCHRSVAVWAKGAVKRIQR